MKQLAIRIVAAYLACGLILRLVAGHGLWSLATPVTMLFWPFVIVGWIAKLLFVVMIVAAAYLFFFRKSAASRR